MRQTYTTCFVMFHYVIFLPKVFNLNLNHEQTKNKSIARHVLQLGLDSSTNVNVMKDNFFLNVGDSKMKGDSKVMR